MRNRNQPTWELLRLAGLQAGMLSSEQVRAHGLARESATRLVRDGHWQRVEWGLFYTESRPPPWEALAWGGVLLGGDAARLGGEASLHLHGLGGAPEIISVLRPHGWSRPCRAPWEFVQERPGLRHRSVGDPPRLDLEDTIVDLCERSSPGRVVDLITRSVQTRQTTADRLRRRVGERARLANRALMLAVLADVDTGAESPLEVKYLREVERPHGLPRGRRQQRNPKGRLRDVCYEEFGTVVELDGRLGHEELGRFRDMRRDNDATLSGEATLRYGWHDVVERGCAVAWQVGAVLAARGWPGVPSRCQRCRSVPAADGPIVDGIVC